MHRLGCGVLLAWGGSLLVPGGHGWKEYAGCKRHILGHGSTKQYTCDLLLKDGSTCTFSSNHSATMFAHKNGGKHVAYEDYKFQCKVCWKRFPLRQGLERHMKKHARQSKSSAAKRQQAAKRAEASSTPPPIPSGAGGSLPAGLHEISAAGMAPYSNADSSSRALLQQGICVQMYPPSHEDFGGMCEQGQHYVQTDRQAAYYSDPGAGMTGEAQFHHMQPMEDFSGGYQLNAVPQLPVAGTAFAAHQQHGMAQQLGLEERHMPTDGVMMGDGPGSYSGMASQTRDPGNPHRHGRRRLPADAAQAAHALAL
eukprot:jgi/Tetstr1/424383/TSEL_014942.t2